LRFCKKSEALPLFFLAIGFCQNDKGRDVDMAINADALYELSRKLSFGVDEVEERVRLAVENVKAYFEQYKKFLKEERWISKASEVTPLIALQDFLEEHELAYTID
jgi:hypothetical protein